VVQYAIDMAQSLQEAWRLLKKTGRLILVVGRESNVMKTPFYNGHLLGEIACSSRLWKIGDTHERQFVNRFGVRIKEDVLHLLPLAGTCPDCALSLGRRTARQALVEASSRCPDETRPFLDEAVRACDCIMPSPLFGMQASTTIQSNLNPPVWAWV